MARTFSPCSRNWSWGPTYLPDGRKLTDLPIIRLRSTAGQDGLDGRPAHCSFEVLDQNALLVVGVAALGRKLLLLATVEVGEGAGDDVAVLEPGPRLANKVLVDVAELALVLAVLFGVTPEPRRLTTRVLTRRLAELRRAGYDRPDVVETGW